MDMIGISRSPSSTRTTYLLFINKIDHQCVLSVSIDADSPPRGLFPFENTRNLLSCTRASRLVESLLLFARRSRMSVHLR